MTDKTPAPMRIISLQVDNFMRIKAVSIRPDKSLVEIRGKNEQGKSSLLNAMWAALAGKAAIPPVPIRKGEETASIRLDLGTLKIVRKFKLTEAGEYTTSLTVESDEGARFTKPQDVLNSLVGELSFDPLEFKRMKPKEQAEALKALVPGVDFAAIAKRRLDAFEARTGKKRRMEELRAQADGVTLPAGPAPVEVDLSALEAKLGQAAEHNTLIERRKARRDETGRRLDDDRREAADLEDKLEDLRARIAATVREIEAAEPLPDPIDTAQVQVDLQAARVANAGAQKVKQRRELEDAAKTFEAEVDTLTKTIKACDDERTAAVTKAKMPIDGLGFGDDEVLFNGLPFSQASDAMQLRTSIAIAGALNPRLRVLRVKDGSLLDEDALKMLADYAEEHDLQVWCEMVGNGPTGFVLENGQLKGDEPIIDAEAAPAPVDDEEGF